jgi:hypothetical protein
VRVFFFENCLVKTPGEAKYWKHYRKTFFFFDNTSFLKAAKFFRKDSSKKKKRRTPICLKYSVKKFEPDRPNRFEEKGGKLYFFVQKLILRKTRRQLHFWSF